jgi:hypothetical protein
MVATRQVFESATCRELDWILKTAQLLFLRKKAGADMPSPSNSEAPRMNEDQNTK